MTAAYTAAKHVLYHATCFCKAFQRNCNCKSQSQLPSSTEKWVCLAGCVFNCSVGSDTVSLLGSAPLIDHIAHVMHLLGFPCENIAVVSIAWSQLDDCLDWVVHERPSAFSQQDLHAQNSPASTCHSAYIPSSMALSWWSETRAFLVENRNDCPRTNKFEIKKQLLIKSWGYSQNIQWGWNNSAEEVRSLYQLETGFGFKSYPHL